MNEEFVKDLKKHKRYFFMKLKTLKKSKNTIEAYDRNINKFFDFLLQYEEPLSLDEIAEQDIFEYLEYRNEVSEQVSELSDATKNQIISNLSKFFDHIEKNEKKKLYDFSKVFEDIKIKKIVKEPKGLEKEDIEKLLNYLEFYKKNTKNQFLAYRNAILIKIMIFAGARVSEAINIKVSDFSKCSREDYFSIQVIGKGNKTRKIYIEKLLIENDLNFISNLPQYSNLDTKIAITINNNHLDRYQMYKAANVIYKKAGINISELHILRHTYAKTKIKNVSINVLQKLLGHSDIKTTSIYTNPTEKMIEDSL